MDNYFIKIARIKGDNGIQRLAAHHKREFYGKATPRNIDQARSHLNYSLLNDSTPRGIAAEAEKLLAAAGHKKLRKNAVVGIEVLFSLPSSRIDTSTQEFFLDCLDWLKKEFPIPILSFDVHLDESAPHGHAILLPLSEGRMIGSEIIGFIGKLNARIKSFAENVGYKHSLYSINKSKKMITEDKERLSALVLLNLRNDSVMKSTIWPIVRDIVRVSPTKFADILNLQQPQKKVEKTFVQIMTSKGKGPKTEQTSYPTIAKVESP